jgi:Asp-tRNA(Asn)/Glu-tRNA(Gln) amidotransferase A subunit family amidase
LLLLSKDTNGAPSLSDDLTSKSAAELVALIRARAVSPVEIVEAHLRRIEQINPQLNAIVTIAEDALDRARHAESVTGGELHGLPITIKDTIDTAGLRTTAGSKARAHYVPYEDAPAVARLKAAGAIILGKTNTPEMAIPYETDNPVFGRTNNPHARKLTCGGSSGGEAAAIAACLSPAGLGSDLSGSIRVPAHFCGIAGLKPTSGRVPIEGHTPATMGSLSLGACIGPMARHVEDLALLFRVLADPTQFEMSSTLVNLISDPGKLRGLRVAWYTDDGVAPVSPEIRDAVQSAARVLADAGLEVNEMKPPGISRGAHLWVELFAAAAQNEIAARYRGHESEAGPAVAKLMRRVKYSEVGFESNIKNAERLADAVLERERLREDLLAWMRKRPLILAPVGATVAFEHGAERVEIENQSISIFRAFSYSQTFNVFGLPSLAVPVARTAEGLPIGVQVVGGPFEERTVFGAGLIIEKALGGWQPAT